MTLELTFALLLGLAAYLGGLWVIWVTCRGPDAGPANWPCLLLWPVVLPVGILWILLVEILWPSLRRRRP